MLNNKKFNIVLSLIIAVCLWAYVVGEINPTDTETFKNIPIQLVNGQELSMDGLAVSDVSHSSINITLSGSRSAMSKVEPKDVMATVDLGSATEGTNQIKIKLTVPERVDVEQASLTHVSVYVEKSMSKQIDISVDYVGQTETPSEATTVGMSKKSVTVTGAKSLVDKVKYAKAAISMENVETKEKKIRCPLVPVDSRGNKVENVELASKTVEISTVLKQIRKVTLSVPIINEDDTISKEAIVPPTVTIKGIGTVLDKVKEIKSKPIDLTDILEDKSVEIKPILPEGVELADSNKGGLYAEINVEKIKTKTFNFDNSEIELKGIEDTAAAPVVKTETIKVTVAAGESVIDDINKTDIAIDADVSNLGSGIHLADVNITCNKKYVEIKCIPKKIKIEIVEE